MSIHIIEDDPLFISANELARYQREYEQAYMFYAGIPPTIEEFIKHKKSEGFGITSGDSSNPAWHLLQHHRKTYL